MLTLKEKIAQMLICGIDGTMADERTKALVRKVKVGGVILYGKNTPTAQVTFGLTHELQTLAAHCPMPLIIAIDEEHGRVSRIKEGTTRFVDMAVIGTMDDPAIAGRIAAVTARELRACGINMNFAPVADVKLNPANKVIGNRSFSHDPEIVAGLAAAYIKEGVAGGMILCVKHFPGHGDTSVDSHHELPTVDKPVEEIRRCELAPFKAAISAGVQAVMTAHIMFPRIDSLPATMSGTIIRGLLQKELGFGGVIISDDMEMGAIAKHYGVLEAFANAINAGVNMFILSGMLSRDIDPAELVESIEQAVTNGRIDNNMIDISVKKITDLKNRYITGRDPARSFDGSALRKESSLEFAQFLEEVKRTLDEEID